MNANQKAKRKVRNSKQWTKFRKEMYTKCHKKDEITGKPLRKGWQLHHLDMSVEDYDDLDPSKFICVNRQTHEMIHWLFRYDDWKDLVARMSDVIAEMKYYAASLPPQNY